MHKNYLPKKISCVYVDKNKRAIVQWKDFQTSLPTEAEMQSQLYTDRAYGIAVICGAVSGGLEIIDIDCKYDLTGKLFEDFLDEIPDSLKKSLYIVKTVNGGYHLYYYCTKISGNLKLASRYTTDDERKENPTDKVRVLIETRGEGGYAVAPPTEGYDIAGAEIIPTITPEQRAAILTAARSFNKVVEPSIQQPKHYHSDHIISPFEDYNKRGVDNMIDLLKSHGWKEVRRNNEKIVFLRPGNTESKSSGDFNFGLGWFSVFTTSTEFIPNKAYRPAAVFCKLECKDDWKECARRLSLMGYGEERRKINTAIQRDVLKKKEEGATPEEVAMTIAIKHKLSAKEASDIVAALDRQWGVRICTFWDVDKNGKISVVRTRLHDFLADNGGFYLYYYDRNSSIYKIIQIQDGFVEEVTTEHIKKFIKNYILSLPETFDNTAPQELLEVILKSHDALFSKGILEFMPRISLNILRDSQGEAFFSFQNGVVKITKNSKELLSYGDLGLHVWRSQVIPFRVDIDAVIDWDAVEFMRFINKICNEDFERIKYVISLIGYLLHKYKDPTRPFAVILAEETEKDKEGGGTGKGIFFKAISKLINTVFVDGKNFKLDKTFAFQRVGLDTQLIIIEDCRKNVDFEGFYSNITEGVTVEKKNKDELYISYSDSPKFGFTTNYTINLVGNHAKRRAQVVEFSNFFHPQNTPLQYFGHQLFDDWDDDEWNRFYNLLFECVQLYMIGGVPQKYASESLKKKQIKNSYGEEFLDFFEDIEKNQWLFFSEAYTHFLKLNDLEKKDYSLKRFKSGLEAAADVFGFGFEERRNRQNLGKKEFFISAKN